MAGSFLKDKELYDLRKSEERTNAILKREGNENHHVETVICGCPDPTCGGWHQVDETRPLPTKEDCDEILKQHNRAKKRRDA